MNQYYHYFCFFIVSEISELLTLAFGRELTSEEKQQYARIRDQMYILIMGMDPSQPMPDWPGRPIHIDAGIEAAISAMELEVCTFLIRNLHFDESVKKTLVVYFQSICICMIFAGKDLIFIISICILPHKHMFFYGISDVV